MAQIYNKNTKDTKQKEYKCNNSPFAAARGGNEVHPQMTMEKLSVT
ncbi:MAG: hypothetical protein J6S05_02620 [Bacteroidaceae bacterium]|nr:hypothetical protein [Bacteroidaceae bacterium]